MRISLSLFAFLAITLVFGQKQKEDVLISNLSIPNKVTSYTFSNSPYSLEIQDVKLYLDKEYNASFELKYYRESPVAHYYLFQQTHANLPIFGAEIKLTLDKSGAVKRVDDSHMIVPLNFTPKTFSVTKNDFSRSDEILHVNSKKIIVLKGDEFISAVEADVSYKNADHIKYVLDENKQILFQQNLNSHFHSNKDTVADVMVFNPDPLTKANLVWSSGDDYDKNDSNEIFLDPLRELMPIEVTLDSVSGEFLLENDRCIIKEFSSPVNPIVTSPTPMFDFSRSHYGFEQVNAYYHITKTQKHLVNLGFNLVDYQIQVDVNALNGQDNSMFNFQFNPPRLFFGEGGVDDAEDADVVVHEYGHAISHSASGASNVGTERRCLDEALGDYFACSYSYALNPFKWENVFSWDGHNQYWTGRAGDNPSEKNYQQISFTNGNIYAHTDLWVSALMEINMALGRFNADQLVVESLYGYFPNMTFTDAAMLIVQADSLYNNGSNVPFIWNTFYNKGILPSNPVSIYENNDIDVLVLGTLNFANGDNLSIINKSSMELAVRLIDINGNVVLDVKINQDLSLNGSDFKSGVYILNIENDQGQVKNEKIIRF